MDKDEFLKTMLFLPKDFLKSDAFLKIKALIWTEALETVSAALVEEEKALSTLQVELLGLHRNKKKCYKNILEQSLDVQKGKSSAEGILQLCKNELEEINQAIEELEFKRDAYPNRVKILERHLFYSII